MAAPVNANINVFANTEQAMAQFRALQAQVAATNKSIAASSGTAVAQQAALNKALMDGANASRMWSARMVPMNTAVQQFSTALDKGKMSLGQYTRYAASQLPGMSRVFRREFDMMTRAATENVRRMQTQYVALGNSATGAAQAMALTPTALNKQAAATAIAAQRQMMMNRMIDLGTTKLLNWGKNTQWAGRQLMVGFSIPLAMVGAVAAKTFKEIDKGSIAFKRVYGDLSTTTAEMERNLAAVKELGAEYTRYGLKLSDTIELAADVAATGAKNNDLLAATEQTLRLSTLGLMEYGEALEATISLQTAFGVSSEDLGSTIDFLNVVENETILTMQDMAAAIPRVAPVIKGLGGDVKDLAVLMTAMREGGVTAAEGANALKTGLGRLINPTKAARDTMDGFGISLETMIQSNRGNLMGMINDFGTALATLDDFEQQQALEKVFGKRQYARLGALFKNIANDASQAQRTVELTNMSIEELGSISERELGKIEEATSTKFAKAIEQLKVSIAPIGEQFMKALTPVINFITKIADKFNDLPDNIKNAISIGVAAIAGIGPIVLMTVGLIANGIANIGKLIQTMRKFFARLKGNASAFNYLTQEEQEAAAAARSLSGATDGLTGKFLGQQKALERLIVLVGQYSQAMRSSAMAAPMAMGMGSPIPARTTTYGPGGLKMAKGGVVPGTGNKDTVPAMLTPGESVVTKEATQRYGPMIQAMNEGKIPGFVSGVVNVGAGAMMQSVQMQTMSIRSTQSMQRQVDRVIAELVQDGVQMDQAIDRVTAALTRYGATMEAAGKKASAKTLKSAMQAEGLTRSSRTLVAAHLTSGIRGDDPRVMQALSGHSQALRDWVRANPQYVQATSKLTATLPALLNQQLARGGATFGSFRQQWRMGGKDKFLNAAAMTDDTIKGDAEAGKALRKMAGDVGRRAILVAKAAGSQKVKDEHLVTATQQVIDKYKAMGGSATKAATALERAAAQVGQVRIQMPKAAVQQGLASGTLLQQGRSVVAARGGFEVARDRGARGASNIPIAGGLATASARQQAEILAKVMASNGPVVAASYYATNTPAMVAGAARTAQQVAQTSNAVIEANTQDIAVIARDRGSPHPIVGKDAVDDAMLYNTKLLQTLNSMGPVRPKRGLIKADIPNAPQGTSFRAPGGGVAQVYNPSNNPKGLGVTGEARAARGAVAAIESRTGVLNRLRAEEEAQLAEQKKLKVTDRRRTNAVRESAVLLEKENDFLARSNQAAQRLAQQRALNEAALKAEEQAQAKLNGAKQREAVMRETMSQRPARGGMLDRPLGALRRFAFPGGQDSALKNLGFNQFNGQVKTAGQLIVESAQNIKTRVSGSLRTLPSDLKIATQQLIAEARTAGSALKTDFKALGTTIKTNIAVDLETISGPAKRAAGVLGKLAGAAGGAAQRMATSVNGFMSSVDSNGRTNMQKFGQAGNTAVMGLMGLSMAASFAGGEVGEMAQKIMPLTMGLMGVQMLLPMLANPLGLTIIAAASVAAGFIYLRKQLDDAAKEAANLGANLGGVANGLQVLEDATGFTAPTLKDRLFRFSEEDREAMSEFGSYFESEAGSKFVEELKEATSEDRYKRVSFLLAQGIASGLDKEKAEAFGLAIAEAVSDSLLSSNLRKDFASGVFEEGSQALINISTERFNLAPQMGVVAEERTRLSGESSLSYQKRLRTEAFQSLSIWQQAIDSTTGIMSTLGGVLRGRGTQDMFMPFTEGKLAEELVSESAQGLGFALQMLEDITNAEAVLAEERRSGSIQYEEAEKRQAELDSLRDKTQDYFRSVIENGADSGAMLQAFGDQLSFRGFDEDQIKRITEAFSPDALAKRFFDVDYSELDDSQKQYVDEVFSKTMSGLTPDNVSQRLQDVEGRWSEIAQSVLNAMRSGADVDVGAAFTQASFKEALSNRSGVGRQTSALQEEVGGLKNERISLQLEMDALLNDIIEAQEDGNNKLASSLIKQRNKVVAEWESVVTRINDIYEELAAIDPAQNISENLIAAEKDLDELGLTTDEVGTRLLEFSDDELIKTIGATSDGFVRLGEAIKYVGDSDISLENVMKYIEENPAKRSAEGVADAMKAIENIKLDEKVFGKTAYLNVEELTQGLMDLGIETEDMAPRVKKQVEDSTKAIASLGKKVKNDFGNIKINVNTVTKLFGVEEETAEGLSNALDGAFPKGLSPIEVPLLLSIMNPDMLAALANMSPDFMEFAKTAKEGDVFRTEGMTGSFAAAGRIVTATDIAAAQAAGAVADLGFSAGTSKKKGDDDKTGPSGGGSAEKSFLEKTREDLEANAALYLTTKRAVEKYGKEKQNFFGIFQELRRRFDVPEGFIASLGTGAQAVANAVEFMQATKKERKQLLELYKENSVGEQIEKLRRDRETRKTRKEAIEVLAANGISLEDAKKAAEDSELATAIVVAAAEGNKKKLNRLLNLIKTEVIAEEDGDSPAQQALDAQREYAEQQEAMFDQQYKQIEMVAYQDFKARTGMSVEGMELQIKKNEDLIDGYRDEIAVINDAIRALETKNGVASDYSDWGLEQLEREAKANQENIAKLERINELTQRRIDDLNRQDELRKRESEAISRDLQKLTDAEDDIRDSYNKRIEALDEVAKVNDYIINQQKQQLDLSRAISEGDIYAATQAAQEMRASSAQFATEQVRAGLEQGMENQIAGLRTAGGLTREQAEQRMADIQEQSYQTSLLIRNLEDEIYNRQKNEILPLKDKEYNLNLAIQSVNDQIAAKQLQIRDIERGKIEPLTKQNDLYKEQIEDLLLDIEIQQANITNEAGQTRDEFDRMNGWITANLTQLEQSTRETGRAAKVTQDLAAQWKSVGEQINAAKKALDGAYKAIDLKPLTADYTEENREAEKEAARAAYEEAINRALGNAPELDPSLLAPQENFAGGMIKKYATGGIVNPLKYTSNEPPPARRYAGGAIGGDGSRDSVHAMLTPGEFVIRKAMVDKYGIPMMKALNQGSFAMPRYDTGQEFEPNVTAVNNTSISNISAPVYNTYDMKFAINGTNQSADEIANQVMFKMRQIQSQGIRGNRG